MSYVSVVLGQALIVEGEIATITLGSGKELTGELIAVGEHLVRVARPADERTLYQPRPRAHEHIINPAHIAAITVAVPDA